LNASKSSGRIKGEDLCFKCGLCCDGTIFSDIKLCSADKPESLKKFASRLVPDRGLVRAAPASNKLPQPCVFFDGCRCRVYPDRPRYCRDFECLLLENVLENRVSSTAAARIIEETRGKAQTVRNLLHTLGDTNEGEPLTTRFQRTTKRLERVGTETEMAETYSELTLAVHDLHCTLSSSFYR
jgi:Fe-S-cluster containining protein